MQATITTYALRSHPPLALICTICAGILFASLAVTSASALVPQSGSSLRHQLRQDSPITEVFARRGGVVRRTIGFTQGFWDACPK